MIFQKYKDKLLCSDLLYLTAGIISSCTLRHCYIAPTCSGTSRFRASQVTVV